METYKFDCGCEFPILDPTIKEDGLPSLDLNFDKISLNCPKTWSIFLEGRTKGVFQVEKSLGQHWSKLVSPTSISDISDLISLMRPGCLGAKDESGKSMAQHYVDRKNGSEEAIPLDPVLYDILKDTQQVLLYQESILEIARVVAGFDLKEADSLRKGVGKKDAKLLASLRVMFIEKAKERGLVTGEIADKIFDNIWSSSRYSFNKCLSPDTLVEKSDGNFETLQNINIGEKINSPDGFITVLDKFDNGEKELYEITLESGKTIQCTLDHKFLTENGIKTLYSIIHDEDKIVCDDD